MNEQRQTTLHHRPAAERGRADFGWLDSRHSFSFGSYYDPQHMGFRDLRVINDDRIAPGGGFGSHPHRDMEIISYVLDGALEHRDSMGNGSVMRPGDVQRMSAGTGVVHSEHNHSKTDDVRLLQIWILPERRGIEPGYEQKHFPDSERRGALRLVASRDGADGSVIIHADARIYAALVDGDETIHHRLDPDRHAWIQVARGAVSVNGESLTEGDGLAISNTDAVEITDGSGAEIILFDLA